MRKIINIAFALALVLGIASVANAQRIDGDLRGEVKDPGGALVPAAKVTITNQGTGTTRTGETTSSGTFFFGSLLPGKYDITVELGGFKKAVRRGVEVLANRVSEAMVTLELGEVTQVVEVTAGAETVQTTTATLVGATFRDELSGSVGAAGSLDGDPINLALTAPGTTSQSGGVAGTGGSIGGNRPRQNNFVVDGLDNNDPSVTGPLVDVIADAVEEFTLLTNQFTAEFGHSTAGQFITTTKSGTNEIHGRGWLYVQNRNLNSLDNITRANTMPGDAKPKFDWQRYGGQAGGPIIKNKLFIFGAYERLELDLAATPGGTILVPTAAGRAALQALANAAGSGVSPVNAGIILDNAPVASSASSSTLVCNVAATGGMPCTTAGPWQVPIELGAFSATTPNFSREHRFQINTDAELGMHRISARFSYQRFRSAGAGELPVPQFNNDVVFDPRRLTISDVWTISPTMANEFRFGFSHDINGSFLNNLPAAPGSTDVFANYNLDDISLAIGPDGNLPQGGLDNTYQALDNFTWIRGAHTVKAGGEYRKIISASDFLPRSRGEYSWGRDLSLGQLSNMDSFVRDFFPDTVSIRGVGLSKFSQNRGSIFWFLQDSWKIHPRVTVEAGIRYEFTQIARDSKLQNLNGLSNIVDIRNEVWTQALIDSCFVNFCITPYPSASPVVGTRIFDSLPARQQEALLAHVGSDLLFKEPHPDSNNWAPRLGIAWDVFGDGKTSVRGGFAVAHDVFFGNLPLLQLPPQAQAENRETNACSLSPAPGWCGGAVGGNPVGSPNINFLSGVGFIEGGALLNVRPFDAAFDPILARALTGGFLPYSEISPETYTWSLALQREIWRKMIVETRYVGTRGVHLPIQRWVSARIPNPFRLPTFASMSEVPSSFAGQPTRAQFDNNTDLLLWAYGFQGVITKFSPDGTSNYHGASVTIRGDIGYGVFLNSSYTWSRTIDLIENELFTSFLNPRRPWDMLNIRESKGLSGLDHEHKFVLNWNWRIPGYKGDQGFVKRLTNGWSWSGTYFAESGQPVTALARTDTNGDFDTAGDRAFVNPAASGNTGTGVQTVCWNGTAVSFGCSSSSQVVGYVANSSTARYIQPARGAMPAGTLVQLGRNTLRSPGLNVFHFSFTKDTPFWGEGRIVRFQADFINAFNHPNFGIGTGSVFGSTANSTGFPGYAAPNSSQFLDETIFSGGQGNAPFQRVIQLSLKVLF